MSDIPPCGKQINPSTNGIFISMLSKMMTGVCTAVQTKKVGSDWTLKSSHTCLLKFNTYLHSISSLVFYYSHVCIVCTRFNRWTIYITLLIYINIYTYICKYVFIYRFHQGPKERALFYVLIQLTIFVMSSLTQFGLTKCLNTLNTTKLPGIFRQHFEYIYIVARNINWPLKLELTHYSIMYW